MNRNPAEEMAGLTRKARRDAIARARILIQELEALRVDAPATLRHPDLLMAHQELVPWPEGQGDISLVDLADPLHFITVVESSIQRLRTSMRDALGHELANEIGVTFDLVDSIITRDNIPQMSLFQVITGVQRLYNLLFLLSISDGKGQYATWIIIFCCRHLYIDTLHSIEHGCGYLMFGLGDGRRLDPDRFHLVPQLAVEFIQGGLNRRGN